MMISVHRENYNEERKLNEKVKKSNLLKTGSVVFVLIIIGKIFSLGREMYFSALFGTSIYADCYFTAQIIPNVLNTPLTVSSLVFFIPLYTKCINEKGKKEADVFASNLMNVYVVFNFLLMLIAIIVAPFFVKKLLPTYSNSAYSCTVFLAQLLVLSFPVTIAVYVLMNVSNANQRHYAPQLLTICNSIISIVLLYFFVPRYGIYAVPIIGVIAWFIQIPIQGYCVRKDFHYTFCFNLKDQLIREMVVLAIPVIIATATEQINLSVDNVLVSSLEQGNVSVLNYAQKLFNLLNGTITTAIITVSYPVISKLYAENKKSELVRQVNMYFDFILFVMLPIMALSMIFREEIVTMIFGRGAFTAKSISAVGSVFMIYIIAIPFAALKELITRIYYIYEESKLPTIINALCIGINIICSILFVKIWQIKGVVCATVISTALCCIIERYSFRKKFNKKYCEDIFSGKNIWKYVVATIILTIICIVINEAMGGVSYGIRLISVSIISLLIYIFTLFILKEDNCSTVMAYLATKWSHR